MGLRVVIDIVPLKYIVLYWSFVIEKTSKQYIYLFNLFTTFW